VSQSASVGMPVSVGSPRFATVVGLAVIGVGAIGWLGWVFDIPALRSGGRGLPRMAPRTAAALVCAGFALVVAASAQAARFGAPKRALARLPAAPWLGRASAAVAALISFVTLTTYILGRADVAVWLPHGSMTGLHTPSAGEDVMAPATALAVACLASALLLVDVTRYMSVFQGLALAGAFLAWPGLDHYLLGTPALPSHAQMAVHTATALLLLSAGTLAVRPDAGITALVASDGPGGVAMRRLLPTMLLVPVLLGRLHAVGLRLSWYGPEAGLTLLALSHALVFGVLVWTTALQLQRSEQHRQRTVDELRASQEELQAIADNSTAVIYVKDLEGRYLLVNRRYEELFHVRREQMTHMTDHDLFPPEIARAFRDMDARALAAGAAVQDEEVVPQDDGVHTYVSVKYPLRTASGAFYATCGISTDITERIRAEHALKDSEARIRAIVDIALDGIIVMKSDGTIAEFNPAAERIFGYRRSDVLGRSLAEMIIPRRMRDDHRHGLARYLGTGEGPVLGARIESTGLRADGVEFPLELSIARLPGSGPPQFAGFIRDITARKAAEQRLQSQIARLNLLDGITRAIGERHDLRSVFQVVIRSLEEHLPIDFGCVCLYDATTRTLTISAVGVRGDGLVANPAMTAETRLEIDENGLSRCVRGELAYEPDISAATSPFCRLLAQGGLASVVLAPLQSESTVFGVLVAARRQPDSFSSSDCEFLRQLSGHVALASHQAQILTALQRAYDDLRQTQQVAMQQERLRALGQMASGIAHDINNALSPVALYTQSLLETEANLSATGREYLETTQRAIEDVADTVARMREFYREPEPQIVLSTVLMNDLVRQVLDLTRARWSDMPQQRGTVITLQLALDPNLPVVAGIESELREALINLVFNAVDAMPDGGTLTVRTFQARGTANHRSSPQVHVEITDTGIGMDEKTRRRCLEPFFTTKGPRGTGLGLAMVYGVMQRHAGEIDIDSEVGVGTTVRTRFPVASSPAEAATAPSAPVSWVRTRILVVDDDPILLKSLRDILERDGHTVVTASSGQDGIDRFRAAEDRHEPFGLVITDLGMPHIDGRQVAAAIRAIQASVPVILLTGWGHRLIAEGDVPPHVNLVLNKPPRLADLRAALAELTARPDTSRQG
jgi:PAS domain S-box-containing protein